MTNAFIVGVACTTFGKRPGSSFKDLTREVYSELLADAGLFDGEQIEQAWFGNCGMGSWGQRNIRGQVCFTPLVRDGLFPERVGMINVEGGCATASMAFQGAVRDIVSGHTQVSLAIGVEKTFVPNDPAKTLEIFEGGIDQCDPEEWRAYYRAAGEAAGKPFDTGGEGGTLFMDTYAMQAAYHMKHHGSTREQIAFAASKNHAMGALNPKAQYRFEVSQQKALDDRMVSWPLTRSMCSPIGDGAAAALVCSGEWLRQQPMAVQERAVAVRASVLTGGKYRALDEVSLAHVAAQRAYQQAGLTPQDIQLAEVHDATSFCELYQAEMLGFAQSVRAAITWPLAQRRLLASAPSTCRVGWSQKDIQSAPRVCLCCMSCQRSYVARLASARPDMLTLQWQRTVVASSDSMRRRARSQFCNATAAEETPCWITLTYTSPIFLPAMVGIGPRKRPLCVVTSDACGGTSTPT